MPAIDALFDELIKRGGSDLHLAVNQSPLCRVRGEIAVLREAPVSAKELEEMLLELVTPAQRNRLASDLDLDVSIAHSESARFRASLFVKHPGIAATFRLVPIRVPSLSELGCPEAFWKLADRRSGLLIVAGPASNGKTTTSAALIDHINKTRACHVVTTESPVEFVHEPLRAQISQYEVGTHVPSVAVALRHAARDNADVVFVSELGSPEDIELALSLAADGALVITNMATSGAAAALDRLLRSFPADRQNRCRGLLADALAGIVVQHLVRGVDGKSRAAVHEIAVGTPEVSALIRENDLESLAPILKAGTNGMQSLDSGLERLLLGGKISPEVALERAIDKEAIARIVARARPEALVDTVLSEKR